MNEYTFSKLDIDKNQKAYHSKEITLRQGDKNGCEITATLYDHGQRITRTDLTVYFTMALPFGDYYYRKQATYNAGVVHITIDESTAASVPGDTDIAYFELRKGTDLIATTEAIRVHIEPSALADKEPGKNYDSAIQNAIDALTEATDSIPEQVQAEVDAQLVAHPEWTTTVQDNSLDDDKLIQKGGILQREQWFEAMLPNIPRKATAEADVHSVTDSAGGGPLGIEVYGRSTQDGTPTPDAPVPIVSVEPDADGGVKLVAAGRNLQPFFSVIPISSTGGYWSGVSNYWTPTSDGWARFTRSVTSAVNSDIAVLPQVGFEVGQTYTVLLEWRNVSLTGTATMYMQDDTSRQLDTIASTNITAGSGRAYVQTTCLHGPTDAGITRFFYWRTRLQTDSSLDGEFRLSIYKGEYAGDYQPYESVTIPIDLQGHALRSLPDGTRDEVNVDEWGHAVLTQRVGVTSWDALTWYMGSNVSMFYAVIDDMRSGDSGAWPLLEDYAAHSAYQNLGTASRLPDGNAAMSYGTSQPYIYVRDNDYTTQANYRAAGLDGAIHYPFAEPVTIDLGHIDPALLPAPDLTAYVVPSAPSVLRYGFDVAQALAEIATN